MLQLLAVRLRESSQCGFAMRNMVLLLVGIMKSRRAMSTMPLGPAMEASRGSKQIASPVVIDQESLGFLGEEILQ